MTSATGVMWLCKGLSTGPVWTLPCITKPLLLKPSPLHVANIYCLSEHHKSYECVYELQPHPSSLPASKRDSMDINVCHLYNSHTGNQCRFHNCKHSHICAICHGAHPQIACLYSSKPPPLKHPCMESRDNRPPRR